MFGNLKNECCLSGEERIQIERSRKIDRELAASKRRFKATQKIVLLGAGESGKSTFLKQMQIIHGAGFSHEEKCLFRTQVYENILRGIVGLINGKIELNISWRGYSLSNFDNDHLTDVALRMKNVLNEFKIIYKTLMDDREKESLRLNKHINISPENFLQNNLVDLIIDIWNDLAIQETFERRREIPRYFVENVPYFIQNIDRIASRDYMPNSADILRARRATTNINEVEMIIENVPFRFVDVGGQRTQRQKWHQCFSDVTAILFLASCSEFDEKLREDSKINRLEESCKVFETLINYKYLKNVEFILFLNKHDLLKEKIKKVNIKNYCIDFEGNPSSINDVEQYMINKFSSLIKHNYDDNTFPNTLEDRHHDGLRQRNVANRHDFDSIYNEKNLNHNHLMNRSGYYMRENKSIYTHFTTAIDTNNIKTIFEMVRLMIFEKNCKAIMLN